MKLIFVKNLINNNLCKKIFNYLLLSKYKNNTKSFIKEFMDVCKLMNLNQKYVIENIVISTLYYFLSVSSKKVKRSI
jgi:hypothetical protein